MQLSLNSFFLITIATATLSIKCRQDPALLQTHKQLRTSVHEGNHSQALQYAGKYERQLKAQRIPAGHLVFKLWLPKKDEKRFPHDIKKPHGPGCNCALVRFPFFLTHKSYNHGDSSLSNIITHFRELPTMGQALLFARILEDVFKENEGSRK